MDSTISEPENRLAIAILLQAADDVAHGGAKPRADALRWLTGGHAGITFELVCGALRLDPSATRAAIYRMAPRGAD